MTSVITRLTHLSRFSMISLFTTSTYFFFQCFFPGLQPSELSLFIHFLAAPLSQLTNHLKAYSSPTIVKGFCDIFSYNLQFLPLFFFYIYRITNFKTLAFYLFLYHFFPSVFFHYFSLQSPHCLFIFMWHH